jgi:hypothetical protein
MTGQVGFAYDFSASKAYTIENCFNGMTNGTAVYELLSDFDSDNPAGGARYIGFVPYWVQRFAINSQREAYVLGPKPAGGANDLYLHRLDLDAAQTWAIGPTGLQTPSTQVRAHVRDLAFDSNDHLWAMVQIYGPPNHQEYYELHRIDTTTGLSTSISTLQVGPNQGVWGLAFLPAPDFAPYCTAKVNSLGCSPSVSAEGSPSVSAPWGFDVRCTNLRSQSNGVLVFGLSGRATLPFHGGALCVQPPLVRTGLQSSNGSPNPDCSGVWTLDFNTWIHQHVALPAGVTVQAQWIGRDSGFLPPLDWTLSSALEFTLLP